MLDYCLFCKAKYETDADYCVECGKPVIVEKHCINKKCSSLEKDDKTIHCRITDKFCKYCGYPVYYCTKKDSGLFLDHKGDAFKCSGRLSSSIEELPVFEDTEIDDDDLPF